MTASTSTHQIAARYATALFQLASEAQALDSVAEELRRLDEVLRQNPAARRVMGSPVVRHDQQASLVKTLSEQLTLSPLTRRFLGTVAVRRRLAILGAMIGCYLALLADKRGEVTAQVRTAAALSPDRRSGLEQVMNSALKRKVFIEEAIDPSLIGGLVVKIGSQMIDASVRTQLHKLRYAMKGA